MENLCVEVPWAYKNCDGEPLSTTSEGNGCIPDFDTEAEFIGIVGIGE